MTRQPLTGDVRLADTLAGVDVALGEVGADTAVGVTRTRFAAVAIRPPVVPGQAPVAGQTGDVLPAGALPADGVAAACDVRRDGAGDAVARPTPGHRQIVEAVDARGAGTTPDVWLALALTSHLPIQRGRNYISTTFLLHFFHIFQVIHNFTFFTFFTIYTFYTFLHLFPHFYTFFPHFSHFLNSSFLSFFSFFYHLSKLFTLAGRTPPTDRFAGGRHPADGAHRVAVAPLTEVRGVGVASLILKHRRRAHVTPVALRVAVRGALTPVRPQRRRVADTRRAVAVTVTSADDGDCSWENRCLIYITVNYYFIF